MSAVVHKSTSLSFSIKKGNVRFQQKETYSLNGDDSTIDVFKGECPLDSDKLTEWLNAVTQSWIDGDSIRADAVAETEADL